MNPFAIFILIIVILFGVLGLTLFITRAVTAEPQENFAPFNSFPLMAISGACMFILTMIGTLHLLMLLANDGTTWREKELQKRIDYLEAHAEYVPVTQQLYTKNK